MLTLFKSISSCLLEKYCCLIIANVIFVANNKNIKINVANNTFMAYIERFKVKGNYYYKLVHAVRKGKSITHKIKYLGKILPPKERLKKIEAEFLSELKSNKYKYF